MRRVFQTRWDLQAGPSESGLTENEKGGGVSLFEDDPRRTPPGSRETHRQGQNNTVGAWALQEIYPPGIARPPVRRRGTRPLPPACRGGRCGAPRDYLDLKDGRQATQLRCKVCRGLSPWAPRLRPPKTSSGCPYGHRALDRWKQRPARSTRVRMTAVLTTSRSNKP